jgi:type II secretory pathway pseudopilin PulG
MMTARTPRAPAGFTILELIIAASIALFVFGIGYLAIATTVRASNESAARIRDAENARLFFNLLERDLASAFPGPGNNVVKAREVLTGPYTHAPSPMVMTEPVNTAYPSSDLLQFYCRSEQPVTRDECVLARYYVNKKDHSLCRQAAIYDPNAQPLLDPPDYVDPTTLTNSVDSNLALFDGVRTLAITYQHWDPTLKQYVRETAGSIPAGSDSLLVTLTFTDTYKQQRMDPYNPDKTTNTPAGERYNAFIYRTYSKVFDIPASFKR